MQIVYIIKYLEEELTKLKPSTLKLTVAEMSVSWAIFLLRLDGGPERQAGWKLL